MTNVAARPQVLLVDEHLAAGLEHQARRPRLGQPGAVDVAGLEGGERHRVLLRDDGDVAGAVRGRPRSPPRRGSGAARCPACRRSAAWRSACPRGPQRSRCPACTTSEAPPLVAPATMRTASPWLFTKALIGRVRTDVGRVERAGEQRLDGGRAGVELLRRELGVAERLGEDAGGVAVDGGRVRDVREVAEAQLGGRGAGGRGGRRARRALGLGGAGRAAGRQGDGGDATRAVRRVFTADVLQVSGVPQSAAGRAVGSASGRRTARPRRDRGVREQVAAQQASGRSWRSLEGPDVGGTADSGAPVRALAVSATGLVEGVRATADPERVQHQVAGGHADSLPQLEPDLLVGH